MQCVHSCTTGLLNQPALLNIAVLFTQERRAAGASRATTPPPPPRPLSLPLASLSSACSRDATSVELYAQRTRTQFEPPAGRLVYLVRRRAPSLSPLHKHTSVRGLMASLQTHSFSMRPTSVSSSARVSTLFVFFFMRLDKLD